MKVLIVSAEVWQDGSNGGNVLSNLFKGLECEVAQIYCNPGEPCNDICKNYYQMTDSMVVRNFFKHSPIGKKIVFEDYPNKSKKENNIKAVVPEKQNQRVYSFFHKYRLGIFYIARHLAWNLSNWKNERLQKFVDDFHPDIIFAPCYGDKFMLRLTRYLADYTGKKVISYISDDSYTLRQFRLSPYFWFNRFVVRHELRKTFPYYSLVYTMTEAQKEQCERDLHAKMKVLRKGISFGDVPMKESVGKPIRIVYAGGIYLNRWKTLKILSDTIRKLNREREKFCLNIFTGNEITKSIKKAFENNKSCILHKSVSQEELAEIYHNSDIALHVESMDLKNRLAVRFSFSTKIVDCLSSGCAVMAICDKKQGGYLYLKEENAAFCISSQEELEKCLQKIAENPEVLLSYEEKARKCCEEKHDSEKIKMELRKDFANLVDLEGNV